MSDTTKMLITAWFSDDEAARGTYLQGSEKIFRDHGMTGATLFRTEEPLVGDLAPHAVVLLEWQDGARARAAFESADYAALVPAREKAFERLDITLLAE